MTAVDFFNQINMLYGTITEFCTETTCPVMSAGPKYEYHWADGHTIKKPIKCSAPKYIDYLMTWVPRSVGWWSTFPLKNRYVFPFILTTILKLKVNDFLSKGLYPHDTFITKTVHVNNFFFPYNLNVTNHEWNWLK